MTSDWIPVSRKPKAYVALVCRTETDKEYAGLCWSTHRNAFIEPISNQCAEDVIGKIIEWRYES
jgi:hypothetical protein